MIYAVTNPNARYSAYMELLEMVFCFLDFHEIKESPRNTQNPVTDLLVSKHPAHSESLNAHSVNDDLADKKTLT